jgi:lipoyl(octanoyl) transferase
MATPSWRMLVDDPETGAYNMAVDEVLLAEAHRSPSRLTCLRFSQWAEPTLSLGFGQKAARVVNFDFCRRRRIGCVRRITGGKAVLHHQELTYSLVSNDALVFPLSDIGETYARIAQALVLGFRHLGIETSLAPETASRGLRATTACFALSNHHEILWSGRKLVGSAQRRTKTAFLQHGSILLDFDPELLAGALGNPDPLAFGSQVACLTQCLGISPAPVEVIGHLQQGFRDFFGVGFELTSLHARQQERAEELARSRYALLDWSGMDRADSWQHWASDWSESAVARQPEMA